MFTGYPNVNVPIKRSGLRVFVHNRTVNPVFNSEGFLVKPNTESDVIVKQTNLNRLPEPYSKCIADSYSYAGLKTAVAKKALASESVYTQKYCLLHCYNNFIIENCGLY